MEIRRLIIANSILKKLKSYLSANSKRTKQSPANDTFAKSPSWPSPSPTTRHEKPDRHMKKSSPKNRNAPNGCFSIYVGPTRQRFVIKTESANHPLFRTLLEDAELEYGFKNEGPLMLPCEVELFRGVLAEIDGWDRSGRDYCGPGYACGSPFLARSRSSYGQLVQPYGLKINSLDQ